MKELLIEEKAKRYDDAIERGKQILNTPYTAHWDVMKELIEHLFPELAESEDERIRKALISFLKSPFVNENITDEKVTPWIAWLEKQAEQKPIKEHDACEFCEDRYGCASPCPTKLIEEEKPTDKIQLGKKYKCIASPRYSTFMIGKIYKPEDKFLCSLMNFCSDCFEPVGDGEQNPADKVEPKFKIGDIISDGFSEVKIVSIDKNNYNVTNDEIENDAHIGNWVVYFKDQDNWELIEQKPDIDQHSLPVSDNSSLPTFDESIYHPCTEEAYEQKPINFNNSDTIDHNLNDYCCKIYSALHKENKGVLSFARLQHMAMDIYGWCNKQGKKGANGNDREIPFDAWSEEDDKILGKCIDAASGYYSPEDKQSMKDWLRSLKDRVQPQPKHKWSEEDERMYNRIVSFIPQHLTAESYTACINWLKSLRPQSHWKPSEEQINNK